MAFVKVTGGEEQKINTLTSFPFLLLIMCMFPTGLISPVVIRLDHQRVLVRHFLGEEQVENRVNLQRLWVGWWPGLAEIVASPRDAQGLPGPYLGDVGHPMRFWGLNSGFYSC